jgi:hypothetical protein
MGLCRRGFIDTRTVEGKEVTAKKFYERVSDLETVDDEEEDYGDDEELAKRFFCGFRC